MGWESCRTPCRPCPAERFPSIVGRCGRCRLGVVCGRFASTQSDAELRDAFRVAEVVGDELGPSYNVAPTQAVRVVLERSPRGEPGAVLVRQLRTAMDSAPTNHHPYLLIGLRNWSRTAISAKELRARSAPADRRFGRYGRVVIGPRGLRTSGPCRCRRLA